MTTPVWAIVRNDRDADVAAERIAELTRKVDLNRWHRADWLLALYRYNEDRYARAVEDAGMSESDARRERWMARKVPRTIRPPQAEMSWSAVRNLAGLDREEEAPVPPEQSIVPAAIAIARGAHFTTEREARRLRDLLDGMPREAVEEIEVEVADVQAGDVGEGLSPENTREYIANYARGQRMRLELDRPPADDQDENLPLFDRARNHVLRDVPGARRIRIIDDIVRSLMWFFAQHYGRSARNASKDKEQAA